MAYERQQIRILEKRLKEKRRFIQVIMGPRQAGKTTLVTQLLKKITLPHYFVSADGIARSKSEWLEQLGYRRATGRY